MVSETEDVSAALADEIVTEPVPGPPTTGEPAESLPQCAATTSGSLRVTRNLLVAVTVMPVLTTSDPADIVPASCTTCTLEFAAGEMFAPGRRPVTSAVRSTAPHVGAPAAP